MAAERYVGRKEIADLLGVSQRTITSYIQKHSDFPSKLDGKDRSFPVRLCLEWKERRVVSEAVSSMAPTEEGGLADAERRQAIANAGLAEHKLALARRQVVDVAVAAREFRNTLSRIRSRLQAVPGEHAPQLLNLRTIAEAHHKLQAMVDQVLEELQDAVADGEEDDDLESAEE
ncbi:MAG: Phage packaging protein Nu1 [Gemmatimonadetes bacterium]|nr:Phage packaging protein Nu1 [Gemmatimonadota bacterium]